MKINYLLIPCRKGSKSILDKNTISIGGKPLILWVLQSCLEAVKFLNWQYKDKQLTNIVVSTNDEKVKDLVSQFKEEQKTNLVYSLARSAEVSTDEASTESVIREFIQFAEPSPDNLILVQATNPFLQAHHLINAFNVFQNIGDYDSVLSVVKSDWFVWKNATPYYNPQKRPRRQELNNEFYLENGSFYMISKENFLLYNCRIGVNPFLYEMPKESMFELDTWSDYSIINKLL